MVYMSRTIETTTCGKASLNLCLEQFSRRNIFVVLYRNFWIFISFYMRFFGMFLFSHKNMNEIHKESGVLLKVFQMFCMKCSLDEIQFKRMYSNRMRIYVADVHEQISFFLKYR